jgi:hypothetical protein
VDPRVTGSNGTLHLLLQPTDGQPSVRLAREYEAPPLPNVSVARADGDAETAELVEAFARSRVGNLKTAIAQVERDIPVLRARMGSGLAEADRLEREARDQASRARNTDFRNNVLLAMFGVPPVLMAAKIIIDGRQYDGLDAAINAASAKRTEAKAKVASFDRQVAAATSDIAQLRAKQAELETALDTGESSAPQNSRTVRLCATGRCLERRQKLLANLTAQLEILETLRSRGIELSGEIDGVVRELRGLVDTATQLLEKAQKQFLDILEGLISKDPRKALTKIAYGRVQGWIKAELQARGLSKELIDQLLKRVRESSNDPVHPYPLLPTPAVELGDRTASFERAADGTLSNVIMAHLSDAAVRETYDAIMANGTTDLLSWSFGEERAIPGYALELWARTRERDLPGLTVSDFQALADRVAERNGDFRPLLRLLAAFGVDPSTISAGGSPLSSWVTSEPPADLLRF